MSRRYAAFVASGCLRNFVIDPKGKEHIVQFAPETWWLADSTSLRTGAPSQYFFDAIEDSDLLLIDAPGHLRLLETVPAFAESFRNGLQRHAAAKDQRIVSTLSATRRGALPRIPRHLPVDRPARSAGDAGVLSRHDAGNRSAASGRTCRDDSPSTIDVVLRATMISRGDDAGSNGTELVVAEDAVDREAVAAHSSRKSSSVNFATRSTCSSGASRL